MDRLWPLAHKTSLNRLAVVKTVTFWRFLENLEAKIFCRIFPEGQPLNNWSNKFFAFLLRFLIFAGYCRNNGLWWKFPKPNIFFPRSGLWRIFWQFFGIFFLHYFRRFLIFSEKFFFLSFLVNLILIQNVKSLWQQKICF